MVHEGGHHGTRCTQTVCGEEDLRWLDREKLYQMVINIRSRGSSESSVRAVEEHSSFYEEAFEAALVALKGGEDRSIYDEALGIVLTCLGQLPGQNGVVSSEDLDVDPPTQSEQPKGTGDGAAAGQVSGLQREEV